MIKQTFFAAALLLAGTAGATDATHTKEACEAAIKAHESETEHHKEALEAAKAALEKHDFAACIEAIEGHAKTEEKK